MEQPIGFEIKGSEHLVCKLNKALYGLKQSARAWEHYLRGLLAKLGILPLKSDQSVYISTTGTPIILIAHVDDITVISPQKERIQQVLDALNKEIKVKDLGEVETFLGMEIRRDKTAKTIELHQTAYTERILAKYRPNLKPKASTKGNIVPMAVG